MTTTRQSRPGERRPAEVFHPGEFLNDEMHERGWTAEQVAEYGQMTLGEVLTVLGGGRMTARMAEGLGRALGPSAAYWANQWQYYRKWTR